MSKLRNIPQLHWYFLGAWLVLNLLQAGFTTLADDEAYYWLYGEHLQWGYFHQPPMIGLFIKIGYTLFDSELGVRLVSVVLNTVALHLIFTMTDRSNARLFWAIVAGTLLVHVAGFFAVPDSPLIFFATLFIWLLKKYLVNDNWGVAALLGVSAGCLLLGKYHGILVLGFALLANLSLLKRKSFYVILLVALLTFAPHVYWQFVHDFPGFGYHLSGRFNDPFNIEHIGNFFLGQLLVSGPLIGVLTIYGAFKHKATDAFTKTLKWIFIGEMVYFFIWSFKGRVEANWTAGAFIGIFILSYNYFKTRPTQRKWLYRLSIPSILMLLFLRLNMVVPVIDIVAFYPKWSEFHGWEEFTADLEEIAGDRALMANSYQMASKLSFYHGTVVPSLNQYARGNEFDLWNFEHIYANKPAAIINGDSILGGVPVVSPRRDTLHVLLRDSLKIFNRVVITPLQEELRFKAGELVYIEVEVDNPYPYAMYGDAYGRNHHISYISHHWWKDGSLYRWDNPRTYIDRVPPGISRLQMKLQIPEEPGTYTMEPAVSTRGDGWWSAKIHHEVIVEE